jgi:uncharacterized membrane protein
MSQVVTPDSVPLTQDERTMAILGHVLQLVGWWIAPLIIFLIRRQSRFVSFHALQALLLQIVFSVLLFLIIGGFFVFMIVGVAAGPPFGREPPLGFLLFIPIWLLMFVVQVLVWVLAIVYGVKAGRGEWAEYPVIGGWARRLLKLNDGGQSAQSA